jgi:hypothetical protein
VLIVFIFVFSVLAELLGTGTPPDELELSGWGPQSSCETISSTLSRIIVEVPRDWFANLAISEVKWFVMMLVKTYNPLLTLTICGKTIIGT